jgi:hypothetical protein
MPLVPQSLSAQLFAVLNSYPETVLQAAQGLASAYATYAQAGIFLSGTLAPLTAQQAAMMQTLFAAMSAYGTIQEHATAWGSALAAFWVGAPVVGVNAGATIGCPGAGAAAAAISLSLRTMPPDVATAAAELADALHTATTTVTATVSLPGPPFTTITPII